MTARVICGDAAEQLRLLPASSVHMAVTSPPYHGLRDYGIDGQIGLEASPREWCARLVEVFGELRRVLRDDGTLWINCGDAFASSTKGNGGTNPKTSSIGNGAGQSTNAGSYFTSGKIDLAAQGVKPKDLQGLPWLLAFALRDDGWWLRDAIVLAKDAPMPESVAGWRWEAHRVKINGDWVPCSGCPQCAPNDGLVLRKGSWRHTSSYEMLFMFAKSDTYFCDGEALRESYYGEIRPRGGYGGRQAGVNGNATYSGKDWTPGNGRNPRNVWRISSEPLSGIEVDGEVIDHFAAFGREIPRRCIMAATSAKGVCPACGVPWARVIDAERRANWDDGQEHRKHNGQYYRKSPSGGMGRDRRHRAEVGWRPSCSCPPAEPVPAVVLDPFLGSGTTLIAADELGRDGVGIELSPKYARLAEARIERARARRMIGDAKPVEIIKGQLGLFE